MNELRDKYFVRKSASDAWEDITTKFDGVKVLSITDFNTKGKTLNVMTQQWLVIDAGTDEKDYQNEDYAVGTEDGQGNPVVLRENIDISITFIVGNKYATTAIDVVQVHDAFVNYLTDGALYIKSKYTNKEVKCVCLDEYKPTTEKLQRGNVSWMIGTIKLHTLAKPQVSVEPVLGNLYIGFGDDAVTSVQEIQALANVQHYNKANPSGNYTIVCPSLSYLWICTEGTVGNVTSNGFEVPMNSATLVGTYRCYRTYHNIKANTTMEFTITVNE
jgi:hypothetical protein